VTALVELRVLEGPNLYFPRAAIKLTLDLGSLASASTSTAERFAGRIGLRNARPGEPDTGFRQRFAARAVGVWSFSSQPSGARVPHIASSSSKPGIALAASVLSGPADTRFTRIPSGPRSRAR